MIMPLPTMLARIAEELRCCVGEVLQIEATVSRFTIENDADFRSSELQRLDLLRQHLEALSGFMFAAQANMDANITVDVNLAMNEVLLAGLKRRLQGNSLATPQVSGEFEFL